MPASLVLGAREPVPLATLAEHPVILPPKGNPLRDEVDDAARAEHVELRVPIEVEGIRLIADLVASGAGVSILPETAVPDDHPTCAPCASRACRRAGSRSSPRAACSSRWPTRPCTTRCASLVRSTVVSGLSGRIGARDSVAAARPAVNRLREHPTDREDHEAADRVDHVVVGGDDDHDSVMNGYAPRGSCAARVFMRGTSASAHHVAHAMCTLGIAANWFETRAAGPESNDHGVGYLLQRVDEPDVVVPYVLEQAAAA